MNTQQTGRVYPHTKIDQRYLVYFIPSSNFYGFCDRLQNMPMQPIYTDDVIATADTYDKAQAVADALNEQGLI